MWCITVCLQQCLAILIDLAILKARLRPLICSYWGSAALSLLMYRREKTTSSLHFSLGLHCSWQQWLLNALVVEQWHWLMVTHLCFLYVEKAATQPHTAQGRHQTTNFWPSLQVMDNRNSSSQQMIRKLYYPSTEIKRLLHRGDEIVNDMGTMKNAG